MESAEHWTQWLAPAGNEQFPQTVPSVSVAPWQKLNKQNHNYFKKTNQNILTLETASILLALYQIMQEKTFLGLAH